MRRRRKIVSIKQGWNNDYGTPHEFIDAYAFWNLSIQLPNKSIKVIRLDDGAFKDFNNIQIANGDLLTWSNGSDVACDIWYNLIGDYAHAVSKPINKPWIIKDGALVTNNGKPSLYFNGTNGELAIQDLENISYDGLSVFCKLQKTGGSSTMYAMTLGSHSNNTRFYVPIFSNGLIRFGFKSNAWAYHANSSISGLNQHIYAMTSSVANGTKTFVDGEFVSGSGSYMTGNLTGRNSIGGYLNWTGGSFIGYFETVVIYPTDLNQNQDQINDNINNL